MTLGSVVLWHLSELRLVFCQNNTLPYLLLSDVRANNVGIKNSPQRNFDYGACRAFKTADLENWFLKSQWFLIRDVDFRLFVD